MTTARGRFRTRMTLVARIGNAAKGDQLVASAFTEDLRTIAQEVAEAVAAERVQVVAERRPSSRTLSEFASKLSDADAT